VDLLKPLGQNVDLNADTMTKLRNFELNLLDFKGAVDRRFNELNTEVPGKMKRDLQ
jgi:hypothetical protein